MGKVRFLGPWILVFAATAFLAAQQPQPQQERQLSRIFFISPKSGSELQFEKAMTAHADWHRQRKDTWRWDVRYTETGTHAGEYIFISPGHQWKGFDSPVVSPKDDAEHFFTTAAQFVGHSRSIILESRPDLSRSDPAAPSDEPLAMVTYFHLKYGQGPKFEDALRQINQALDQTQAPRMSAWYQAVASGRNSIMVLSSPRANWAAFELQGASTRERVEKTFGKPKADAIYQALQESVEFTDAKITSARPDLSYVPPARAAD
jgi:hypothetical protein